MGNDNERDQMLEVYIYEENQLIDQLEEIMLETEKSGDLTKEQINEIFRIMHTIKGSSAMMTYDNISKLAHSVEDLFYFIRENHPQGLDISRICDLVLSASDFIKQEVSKINDGEEPDGVDTGIEIKIKEYLSIISGTGAPEPVKAEQPAAQPAKEEKPAEEPVNQEQAVPEEPAPPKAAAGTKYIAKVHFEEGGQMENLRAYTIVRNMLEYTNELFTYPADIINATSQSILENGFIMYFTTEKDQSRISAVLDEALFLKSYELTQVDSYENDLHERHIIEPVRGETTAESNASAASTEPAKAPQENAAPVQKEKATTALKTNEQSMRDAGNKGNKLSLISVNVNKLDTLMNLVGEIVISESMVTKNSDLEGLQLDNFGKAARQLRKLTDELQDIVMSIRMVQIAGTFQKMQRIVRDMSHKLNKEVEFVTVGEETEVDKNIIDHLSDPLMHLIRNSMDHGVEPEEERIKAGKAPKARVTLMAQNTGGDVMISVSDDGQGLDRDKILKKAAERGLLKKPAKEMSDKEIYGLIMLPGFSTNENVTEYSGRGVGMDVVRQNIEEVGGNVSIKSTKGEGTTITIVIPLTLAIADAMELSVGGCVFTLPTTTIRESFRPRENQVFYDNMGNEMIMIRGNVYPIIRLHKLFKIETEITKISEGILILVEGENKAACIFADCLLGEQQIVVKPLPQYLVNYNIKVIGIEGCTILGNGSISLILNAKSLINRVI